MITFIICIIALIIGYIIYGRFIDRYFGMDTGRPTPAITMNDGVDFLPLPAWKIFMIQFLNIAGLGPIFGAILGAMYGPLAYLWIVAGCIFMGAVHDYFSGMLSIRNNGFSLPEIVGKYLGNSARIFLRIFTILLLIFVGVAFVTGPAKLLQTMTTVDVRIWLYLVFGYYLLATLLPINKIIGRIYPVFGASLLIMALGIGGSIIIKNISGSLQLGELSISSFNNFHTDPGSNILYPMLFIVISCGAISGFHATQSPLMARCLKSEKQGRRVFYGAMIAEGIVAIIWATAAMNYFGDVKGLNYTLSHPLATDPDIVPDPAWVVNEICNSWLGHIGAIFAIVGVVACPITSGDTAFRSARLTIADMFNIKQSRLSSRLLVSIPLFIIGFFLTFMLKDEFGRVWKFVGISNQSLATIVLWTAAMYMALRHKNHWLLTIPATLLTTICITYIMVAPNKNAGLGIPVLPGYIIGSIAGFISLLTFLISVRKKIKNRS
ncbi:MAG TPA: carbon starvation protein A [Bacteroidales bacterium]|nr:carbon starvation protein A [Bacteroidales bacterium]